MSAFGMDSDFTTGNTELVGESRGDIFYDYPILQVIGWLVVAYLGLFFVTFYVGPALFGTRPYRPYPWRRRRSLASSEPELTDFITRVSNSIDNAKKRYA